MKNFSSFYHHVCRIQLNVEKRTKGKDLILNANLAATGHLEKKDLDVFYLHREIVAERCTQLYAQCLYTNDHEVLPALILAFFGTQCVLHRRWFIAVIIVTICQITRHLPMTPSLKSTIRQLLSSLLMSKRSWLAFCENNWAVAKKLMFRNYEAP